MAAAELPFEVEELLEELGDILCSGYGPEFSAWHRSAIMKLFRKENAETRAAVWKAYSEDLCPEATVQELRTVKAATVGGELVIT